MINCTNESKLIEILIFILELLAQLQSNRAQSNTSATDGPRKRHTATTTANDEKKCDENSANDYTQEQLELCRRIRRCKDYYEILGITKEATDSEIKRAYKKLALQLHPDKNRAPGANEAFKALGNAAGVLTDAEKRKHYDMYGNETTKSTRHYNTNHEYEHAYRGAGNGFDSDFTAEELFNMFFGNGFPQQRNTTSRRYTRYESVNKFLITTFLCALNMSDVVLSILQLLIFVVFVLKKLQQQQYHHHQQQPSLAFG